MLTVVARCPLVPGAEAEFRRLTQHLVSTTRTEPACLSYELVRPEDEQGVLAFFERWADQEGLDQHLASAHFVEAMQALEPLLARPMEVQVFRALED